MIEERLDVAAAAALHENAPRCTQKKKKRVVKIQPFTDLLSRPAIHPTAELEKGQN